MSKSLIRVLCASTALLLCLSVRGAVVAQTTPPVNYQPAVVLVEDCRAVVETRELTIEFTNRGKIAADLIRFKVYWSRGNSSYIQDQGTFPPGMTIKHRFKMSDEDISNLGDYANVVCNVEAIHFVDGSKWYY